MRSARGHMSIKVLALGHEVLSGGRSVTWQHHKSLSSIKSEFLATSTCRQAFGAAYCAKQLLHRHDGGICHCRLFPMSASFQSPACRLKP